LECLNILQSPKFPALKRWILTLIGGGTWICSFEQMIETKRKVDEMSRDIPTAFSELQRLKLRNRVKRYKEIISEMVSIRHRVRFLPAKFRAVAAIHQEVRQGQA